MDNHHLLVINSGSSSIKFAVFELDRKLTKIIYGHIKNLQSTPQLQLFNAQQQLLRDEVFPQTCDYHFFFELLFSSLTAFKITAVGHRVVHGGNKFHAPILLTDNIVTTLKEFIPFAPLHQPYNLEAISTLAHIHPKLPQIACFDTTFHTTHPPVADRFGLPRTLIEEGVKRYGFHGLSYEYIMQQLKFINSTKHLGRVVIAHLGNGASMCAIKNGKSVDSTMGFTAVDGLLMGTRCGNLDPGVLLYCLQSKHMSAKAIENMLYKESGLLGVSGISSNMHELLQSPHPHAQEAIELFVYRIRRELGGLVSTIHGLEVLVFTGGIGENAWKIRDAASNNSEWLGIELDPIKNKNNELKISTNTSKVDVYVIPTNEEWMIAKHCYELIHKE